MSKFYNVVQLSKVPTASEKTLITGMLGDPPTPQNMGAVDSVASGEDWRSLVPPNVTLAESVPGWTNILPTKEGYGLEHYDDFFKTYSALATDGHPVHGGPRYSPMVPSKETVEDWITNPLWLKHQENKGASSTAKALEVSEYFNALILADAPDIEKDLDVQAWNHKVFTLFEKMLGIPARLIPAEYNSLKYTHGGGRFGVGAKGYDGGLYDIKDILLWLYLKEPNARRDNLAEIADQIRDGDVRELAKQDRH